MVQQIVEDVGLDNLVVSPLGVLAALALAMNGANGTIKTSFGKVLFGITGDEDKAETAFIASLDASAWAGWHAALSAPVEGVQVKLALPRFQISWNADLVPALKQLGLAKAFAPGADFSPLGFRQPDGGGFINAVLHKTFLAVDEQGTEAAAVTAMLWMAGGAPNSQPARRVQVKANVPFFYAIVENHSGQLLFAGTVTDLSNSQLKACK